MQSQISETYTLSWSVWAAVANTLDQVIYKSQKLLALSPGAWEAQGQDARRFGVGLIKLFAALVT